ncbi:MAG TPA: carbohydrate ABC transporter permease [Candidatus Limiplasma stercoravium]|nr:carbohydrate ABC transporter permease [Candidatus Limiplasma stercoravium]
MAHALNRRRRVADTVLTVVFSLVSLVYVYPLVMVLVNSFKRKAYISRAPFALPTDKMFGGLTNYTNGIELTNFFNAMVYSFVITVLSVFLILLCTSMCAWFISRVQTKTTRAVYLLCIFSMVVPFQMVMFTLSKVANVMGFNTPWTIPVIYLGFGAGLAVFMFTGYMKACPIAIEESAMIDGCKPLRTFFSVVLPILQPTYISTGILETMWIWNDYLLPYLVLDLKRFKTIPIAVQYLKGGYGSVDMGAMMAVLVLAIVPIIVFYLLCQKYIVSGVMAGAVKG